MTLGYKKKGGPMTACPKGLDVFGRGPMGTIREEESFNKKGKLT